MTGRKLPWSKKRILAKGQYNYLDKKEKRIERREDRRYQKYLLEEEVLKEWQ